MYNKELKIFGAFRTGSNLVRSLLELNFEVMVHNNTYAYKHIPVPADFKDNEYVPLPLGIISTVKDPFAFLDSTFRYCERNNFLNIDGGRSFDEFCYQRFIVFDGGFKEFPRYRFANPIQYWNSIYQNLLSLPERQNCILRYEDLLVDMESEIRKIAKKFDLCSKKGEFILPTGKTSNLGDPERTSKNDYFTDSEFKRKDYYLKRQYMERFTEAQKDFIYSELDHEIMQALSYEHVSVNFNLHANAKGFANDLRKLVEMGQERIPQLETSLSEEKEARKTEVRKLEQHLAEEKEARIAEACKFADASSNYSQQIDKLVEKLEEFNHAVYGVSKGHAELESKIDEGQHTLKGIEALLENSDDHFERVRYIQHAVKKIYRKQFIDRNRLDETYYNLLKLGWLWRPFSRIAGCWSFSRRAIAFVFREPRKAVNYALSLIRSRLPRIAHSGSVAKDEIPQSDLTKRDAPTKAGGRADNNAGVLRKYAKALEDYCKKHPDYPLVILNSTAKPLEETLHIKYRSTFILGELEKAGYPAVFAYYNWEVDPSIKENQVLPVIELPADGLLAFAPHLAKLAVPNKKLFICGIPDFRSAQLVEVFRRFGFVIAYDCWDEHEIFASMDLARWFDKSIEQYIALNSDVVFAVCPSLVKKLIGLGVDPTKANVCRNGVSGDQVTLDIQNTLKHRENSHVIGYIGNLSDRWFDWSIVTSLARALPKYRIELIGPNAEPPKALPNNVDLRGAMTNEEAFSVSSKWRAGIIPHLDNDHIQHADSIKVYEFLGWGMPIVTIHKEFLKDYPMTFTYRNVEEAETAIRAALKFKASGDFVEKYNSFIKQCTWKSIMSEMLSKSGVLN